MNGFSITKRKLHKVLKDVPSRIFAIIFRRGAA
jgi:hypothetical protein